MKKIKTYPNLNFFYTSLHQPKISKDELKQKTLQRLKTYKMLECNTEIFGEFDVLGHFCTLLVCSQLPSSKIYFVTWETAVFKKMIHKLALSEVKMFFWEEFLPNLVGFRVEGNFVYITPETRFMTKIENVKESMAHISVKNDLIKNNESLNKNNGSLNKNYESVSLNNESLMNINESLIKNIDDNSINHCNSSKNNFQSADIFKRGNNLVIFAHFTKISDLIARRAAFPENGYCQINDDMISSLLVNEFRNYLEHKISKIQYDERIHSLAQEIFNRSISSSTLDKIKPKLAPCISGIISTLETNKHLKYNDRLTLARFLKEAGIGIEQCVQLFRDNFSCSREKFDKEYLYSLRHTYGLEGKRANYTCFSCQKIAHQSPAFGCPFKSNHGYLKKFVEEKGLSFDIEDLNFQMGCAKMLSKIVNKDIQSVSSPIDYLKNFENENIKEDLAED